MRRHPSTWITALLVALALAGAGVTGVIAAARVEEGHRREAAQGAVGVGKGGMPC